MWPAGRNWHLSAAAAAALAIASGSAQVPAPKAPAQVADIVQISYRFGQFPQSAETPVDQTQCRVERDLNRLVCLQKEVHLWAEYVRPAGVLKISGLFNPDLELSSGSTLTVTAMSLDPHMTGEFDVSKLLRPPMHPETIGRPEPWRFFPRFICGSFSGAAGPCVHEWALPPPMLGNIYTATLLFKVRGPGVIYYSSLDPPQARAGNWGRILVVP